MLKVGDRIKYNGKNAEITDIWFDGQDHRVEFFTLQGNNIWSAKMESVELLSKSKQKKKD